jgi:hypothetical protein
MFIQTIAQCLKMKHEVFRWSLNVGRSWSMWEWMLIACPRRRLLASARVNGFERAAPLAQQRRPLQVPSFRCFPDAAIKGVGTCARRRHQNLSHPRNPNFASILPSSILCPPSLRPTCPLVHHRPVHQSLRLVAPTPHFTRNGEGKKLW